MVQAKSSYARQPRGGRCGEEDPLGKECRYRCEEEERNKGEPRLCQGTCVSADVISMQEEVGDNKNIFLLMFFTL